MSDFVTIDDFIDDDEDAMATGAAGSSTRKTNRKVVWNAFNLHIAGLVNQAAELVAKAHDALFYGPESSLATASTVNLKDAASRLVKFTGTTTVTSLGAIPTTTKAAIWKCRADGAFQLTHGASLDLIGSANITTAAGDTWEMEADFVAGVWRMRNFQRKTGAQAGAQPVNATLTALAAGGVGHIIFPATQNATADPNTLDDYEEGTWVPALDISGAAVGVTYSARTGTYTKIGRMVHVTAAVSLSNKGSSVGSVSIVGLPFIPSNYAACPVAAFNTTLTSHPVGFMDGGGAIQLYKVSGPVANSELTNTSTFTLAASYPA